jgi:hypothetical protein
VIDEQDDPRMCDSSSNFVSAIAGLTSRSGLERPTVPAAETAALR